MTLPLAESYLRYSLLVQFWTTSQIIQYDSLSVSMDVVS